MLTVKNTIVENNQIVLPNDLNGNQTLFGGTLVSWVDKIAAIAAYKHCKTSVVTISIDSMSFKQPVPINSVVKLIACVNRVFNTSMEVGVKITAMLPGESEERDVSSAYLTFVAIDKNGQKKNIEPVEPQSDEEKRRYRNAEIRRNARINLREELH